MKRVVMLCLLCFFVLSSCSKHFSSYENAEKYYTTKYGTPDEISYTKLSTINEYEFLWHVYEDDRLKDLNKVEISKGLFGWHESYVRVRVK